MIYSTRVLIAEASKRESPWEYLLLMLSADDLELAMNGASQQAIDSRRWRIIGEANRILIDQPKKMRKRK